MKTAKMAAALATLAMLPSCVGSLPEVVPLTGLFGVTASGVVVAPGWVLTASHVLPVMEAGGLPVVDQYPHPDLDLALLSVPGAEGRATFGDLPELFDPLRAVGYHLSDGLLLTDGYQGGTPGRASTPIIHGCSGGAIVNARGELVGIVSRVSYCPTGSGQDHAAVPHCAWYVLLDDDVTAWIQEKTRS